MTTIIVGKRSNLSKELNRKIKNSMIISSKEFLNLKNKNKTNIIINNFFPASEINNLDNYDNFINLSLSNLAKALDQINKKKIRKIIYTSSSSIYGFDVSSNFKDDRNREIYSKAKFLAETIIINFCKKNDIKFIIARVFNIYGNNDKFSIISKIIKSFKKKNFFYLNNLGSAIRDFISYEQVCEVYKKMLNSNDSGVYDVGCAEGYQINEIIDFLGKKNFLLKKKSVTEIPISVAEKNKFNHFLSSNKLVEYLKKNLNIKKNYNFSKHLVKKNISLNTPGTRTAIYGAGNAGQQINTILSEKNPNSIYCFIDDDKKIQNKIIDNKKVVSLKEFKSIAFNKIVSNVIISIPSIKPEILEKKIKMLKSLNLNVNYLPFKENLISDKISLDDVRYSQLTNLLDKDFLKSKNFFLNKLKKNNILVTGAAGSIGKALCNKIKQIKTGSVIALDKSEIGIYNLKREFINNKFKFVLGDINDSALLQFLKKKYKINLVLHAAAYKHLNILEDNVGEAVKNNIFGTLNIVKNFINHKIIIISTDKAANPSSVLGFSKRISEIISLSYQNKNSKINVVRFGNVFASQGSAINLFLEQINSGGPITITNKRVERYFMSSSQAANLVLKGSLLPINKKILILNMGKQIKVIKIIKKLLEIYEQKSPLKKIRIKEIGLAKGEKLKEKLFMNKAEKIKGENQIFIANEPNYDELTINILLDKLKHYLKKYDNKKLLKVMKSFLIKEIKA